MACFKDYTPRLSKQRTTEENDFYGRDARPRLSQKTYPLLRPEISRAAHFLFLKHQLSDIFTTRFVPPQEARSPHRCDPFSTISKEAMATLDNRLT
jgi:hypothetical protein